MNKKLVSAEKGDMYDFRLDGGMSTQDFEGKDYSDLTLREAELNALACLPFIDPGKRERKAVASSADTIACMDAERKWRQEAGDSSPSPSRPHKVEDWQFCECARINKLHNEEIHLFDEMIEKGEVPSGIIRFTRRNDALVVGGVRGLDTRTLQ